MNRASQPSAFLEKAGGHQIVPLPIGRPAYEVYIGARVLATYATMRKRPEYLGTLLSRFVKIVTEERHNDSTEPLLFWPFAGDLGLPRMMNGRNEDCWQERVSLSWPEVFGSKDAFLSAAAGLELILELSSHIFVHDAYPELKPYKESHPRRKYTYLPDFWKNPIGPAVPTAEWIFDKILSEERFPGIITIEPDLIQKIFAEKTRPERQLFFGEFLFELRKWHDEMIWRQQRLPFHFAWPESLQSAVDKYRENILHAN